MTDNIISTELTHKKPAESPILTDEEGIELEIIAAEPAVEVEDDALNRFQAALISLFFLIGSASGLLYIAPAWRFLSKVPIWLALPMVSATVISVSGYTGWGWVETIKQVFFKKKIPALTEQYSVFYEKILYPAALFILADGTLLPMVALNLYMNSELKFLSLFPLVTDLGLRALPIAAAANRLALRSRIQRWWNNAPSASAEEIEFINLSIDKLSYASSYSITQLNNLPAQLGKIDGKVFSEEWISFLQEIITITNKLQAQETVFLMKKPFKILPLLTSIVAALALSFTEMYATKNAIEEVIPNPLISTSMAIPISTPVGILQFFVVHHLLTTFHRFIALQLSGIKIRHWTSVVDPHKTMARRIISMTAAAFSWAHYANYLEETFSGNLLTLLIATVIPANCLLLMMGPWDLLENLQISYLNRKQVSSTKPYYALHDLIDILKCGEPENVISFLNTLPDDLKTQIKNIPAKEAEQGKTCFGFGSLFHKKETQSKESSLEVVCNLPSSI